LLDSNQSMKLKRLKENIFDFSKKKRKENISEKDLLLVFSTMKIF